MSVPWTEERIPQALRRKDSLIRDRRAQNDKREEIDEHGYARWIFVCLPGPVGDAKPSKLFVFIDVVEAKMDLEKTPGPTSSHPNGKNGL